MWGERRSSGASDVSAVVRRKVWDSTSFGPFTQKRSPALPLRPHDVITRAGELDQTEIAQYLELLTYFGSDVLVLRMHGLQRRFKSINLS
jgi:hypothetical protein